MVGMFAFGPPDSGQLPLSGFLVTVLGTVLLLVGLAYYAKAKGRHPAWCLAALLSWVGLIVLGVLSGKAPLSQ